MCLAVPGKVVTTVTNALGIQMGTVSFGGISKEICLALLPEVKAGDYVLVHAGMAINVIDEAEAAATLELLRQLGEHP
jgi:hydrogenase expression/formation protein HypC